jgi:hypothetical protein
MAGCDVLYYDPAQIAQARRNPTGNPLGPASNGWQPCTAPDRSGPTPTWSFAGSAPATAAN